MGGGGGWGDAEKEFSLCTLPYHLFILLQNFRQFLIPTLEWKTEGQNHKKIKSISHPKDINNIKDKCLSLKQIHSYEIIFYYYKKINKPSKEFF